MRTNETYQRLAENFEQQPFLKHIGATLEHVEYGKAVLSIEKRPELLQQHGFLHAGVTTTLADVACGIAALSAMPEGSGVLSTEFKINLMRPATTNKIIATAELLKPGKTLYIVEATVTDVKGKIIAKMLATMIPTPSENSK